MYHGFEKIQVSKETDENFTLKKRIFLEKSSFLSMLARLLLNVMAEKKTLRKTNNERTKNYAYNIVTGIERKEPHHRRTQ